MELSVLFSFDSFNVKRINVHLILTNIGFEYQPLVFKHDKCWNYITTVTFMLGIYCLLNVVFYIIKKMQNAGCEKFPFCRTKQHGPVMTFMECKPHLSTLICS